MNPVVKTLVIFQKLNSLLSLHPLLLNYPFNSSTSWILNCPWKYRMVFSTPGSSPSHFKAQLNFKSTLAASISPSHSSSEQIHAGNGVATSHSRSGMLSTEWMREGGIPHRVAPATVSQAFRLKSIRLII